MTEIKTIPETRVQSVGDRSTCRQSQTYGFLFFRSDYPNMFQGDMKAARLSDIHAPICA